MSIDFSYLFKILFIFLAYFLTARFGLSLDAVSGFATLVWIPSGISLAAVLLVGYRVWPAIFFGAFLANFINGAPALVALGIGIGNTLEAVVGAYLLQRLGFKSSLERLVDVLSLLLIASLSTIIAATIGVASLMYGNLIPKSLEYSTWLAWWIGDTVSILVILPLLLVWVKKSPLKLSSSFLSYFWEIIVLIILLTFASLIIFGGMVFNNRPMTYIVFPSLIWASLRFGQKGATITIFTISVVAVWSTVLGYGPFIVGTLSENLLSLQLFMAVVSVTGMTLAALASERKEFERRKDEFISVASHELKTPIATVKGYGEILTKLLQNSGDKRVMSYLLRMDQQIDRLTKLVTDLLDVSRIQTNKLELQKEQIRIDDLVKEIIDGMQPTTKHKIIYEGNGNKPILADKYRLSEVLTNIISNAIKYSPKADKIFVKVSDNSEGVRVSVQDFGIGISQKHLDHIFERFFQVENRIRQSFSGLGLGLYISSEIIKSHGGRIWAESVKGKGSTFFFELPS